MMMHTLFLVFIQISSCWCFPPSSHLKSLFVICNRERWSIRNCNPRTIFHGNILRPCGYYSPTSKSSPMSVDSLDKIHHLIQLFHSNVIHPDKHLEETSLFERSIRFFFALVGVIHQQVYSAPLFNRAPFIP